MLPNQMTPIGAPAPWLAQFSGLPVLCWLVASLGGLLGCGCRDLAPAPVSQLLGDHSASFGGAKAASLPGLAGAHAEGNSASRGQLLSAPTRSGAEPMTVRSQMPRQHPASPQGVPVQTDWCTDDVSPLDAETCYVRPRESNRSLLLYLHGIVPPTPRSPQKARVERVVAEAAQRAGVTALIPRGCQGVAREPRRDWWSWPTSEAAYQKHANRLVERFQASRTKLEGLLGCSFEHMYLAGSSAGAYFVTLLALHGGIRVDGFGAMSGGSPIASPNLRGSFPAPFYIGYGTFDSVGPGARALASLLRREGWPVRVAEHAWGHGARRVYLDEAFEFWRSEASHVPCCR